MTSCLGSTGQSARISLTCRLKANGGDSSAQASLICAALTTLAETIAQNVYDSEDTGDTDIIDVTLRSGQAIISYVTDDEQLNTAVDGISKGFFMLAENYPEYVECCKNEG